MTGNEKDTETHGRAMPGQGKAFGARCKNCIYGLPVYKADGLIDCAKKGGVRLEEDGCEEGKSIGGGKANDKNSL